MATVKYSTIVPVHAVKIRRGIKVQHHTLLNKILHDLADLSRTCEGKLIPEPVWTFRRIKFLVPLSGFESRFSSSLVTIPNELLT